MPVLLQALVCLRNDCSNNKQFEEEHFKQLLHGWLQVSVEIDASLSLVSSIKGAKATA